MQCRDLPACRALCHRLPRLHFDHGLDRGPPRLKVQTPHAAESDWHEGGGYTRQPAWYLCMIGQNFWFWAKITHSFTDDNSFCHFIYPQQNSITHISSAIALNLYKQLIYKWIWHRINILEGPYSRRAEQAVGELAIHLHQEDGSHSSTSSALDLSTDSIAASVAETPSWPVSYGETLSQCNPPFPPSVLPQPQQKTATKADQFSSPKNCPFPHKERQSSPQSSIIPALYWITSASLVKGWLVTLRIATSKIS